MNPKLKSSRGFGLFYFIFFAGALLIFGCKHHPIYNGEPIVESNCDSNKVYFQNTILPLLNSHCATPGCHDAATHAEGINLTTYNSIMSGGEEGNLVIPYEPGSSKLYHIIAEGEMPPSPYAQLTQQELWLIYQWIEQGALNNSCTDCDTTQFRFAANIWPIINMKCSGCHGSVNPSGMVSLLNYSDVQVIALNGKLAGVVSGTGYPLMPPSVGLPDCERTKILKWISDGSQNN